MNQTIKMIAARGLASLACLSIAVPLQAEMRPSINLSGQTGLIDMPSGDQLPDAFLTLNHSQFGPIVRNALRFQITPRLSGTFRYIGIHDWNSKTGCPPCVGVNKYSIYYDRNFDLNYQILTEGRYRPAVTIGLQDFVGTGLSSAEYIAATKTFGSRLKVTAGLGFGRLGSYNPIGEAFGPRPKINFGQGGNVNSKQWFHGDVAPFGGVEYKLNDKLTLKAEYSSDAYTEETTKRGTFEHKSPLNFGIEYQASPGVRVGGYYMYGSEFGVNVSFFLNPAKRPHGGIGGPGPEPVKVRPSRQADPATWTTGWTEIAEAKDILFGTLKDNLATTGIVVESLGFTATRAQVRFRNTKYDAAAQAVGRVARAMSQAMPASVEMFELVPVDHGIPGSKVVIRRSDLERFEFAPEAATALRVRSEIVEAGEPMPGTKNNPAAYPRFSWSLLPYVQSLMFSPSNPLQLGVGLRLAAEYELAPGLILSGSVTDLAFSNIRDKKVYTGPGPYVRSDAVHYYSRANPDLQTLTGAWYTRVAPDVYGRVTVGYLEEMFAGVSTEMLWRPVNRKWALGAEANYVAQRNTDGGLGFDEYDYRVATGHVSGYYDFGKDMHVQLDVGRYLRGDVGATLTLTREFENGWRVGAFATKTNLSAKEFGEGSFDKGITLLIPLSWITGKPTRSARPVVIRPVGRDGGARLDVGGRLYEVLRSYDETRMDAQWGRIWK
ncbi:MAG: YjbH domain-containing protein [Cypionkella sp.]